VNVSGSCVPGDDYHVWLWLGGDHGTTIRLVGLHSGDTFSYSGLPAGAQTLGLRGQTTSAQVTPGATVEADVDFVCDGSTEPTDPTTPTDPTESPGTTDPTASASPTPSGAIT
jgi:hypothetical protein